MIFLILTYLLMFKILKNIFIIKLYFVANKVAIDQFGNSYYEHKTNVTSVGKKRRFCIYNGTAESSRVPELFHAWLHYITDDLNFVKIKKKYFWQKEHTINMTGTKFAFSPKKIFKKDYLSWKPKPIICIIVLLFSINNFAFAANKNKSFVNKPLFSDEDIPKISINKDEHKSFFNKPLLSSSSSFGISRNKQLINFSIGAIYQYSSWYALMPYSKSILTHDSLNNVGLDASLTINITDEVWVRLSGEGSWILSGNGTDDDISNGAGIISYQKSKGSGYEIKAVVGVDAIRFKKTDISLYTGFYRREMFYGWGAGTQYDKGNIRTIPDGSWQNMNPSFTGIVVGTELNNYNSIGVWTVFLEGYATYFQSNNTWINVSNYSTRTFSDTGPIGIGMSVGTSFDIKIVSNLYIKPFVKFQILAALGDTNVSDTFNPGYSNSVVGTLNYSGYGNMHYMATTTGINITWR